LHIKNKIASVAYKLLIVLAGLYGLLLVTGAFDGRFNLSILSYFTVLSNLLCVVYFAADIIYILTNKENRKPYVWKPALKGITTMAITVTLLVAHFILGMRFTMADSMGMTLFVMHYAVPLITIADWLLFDPKGLMTFCSPLLWAIGPMVYFAFAMIAARIGDGIGYGGSRYPYPFLDVDKLGWGSVLLTVLALAAFFIALGYVWVLIDKSLAKMTARRKKEVGKA
jgi:hypothetical protein